MAGSDLGALRTLVVAVRLDDMGVTGGLAQIHARTGLVEAAMGRAGQSVAQLRSQLFFLAFTGGAVTAALVKQHADLEKQITLASLAMDGTTDNMEALESQTFRLAQQFNQLPGNVATAVREVQQLGVQSAETREQLLQAALGLSLFTGGELAEEEAAKTIFRLLKATTQTEAQFEMAATAARAYASAIALAGDESAAGIADVTRAVESFSTLGTTTAITRGEIIALSGAITDLEEGRIDRISSSITRLFGRELVEQGGVPRLAAFMGLTTDEFIRMRANDPAELLSQLAGSMREAKRGGVELLPLMRELGFENIRDEKTLSLLVATLEKFRGLLPQVEEELALFEQGLISQSEFQGRLQAILGTTTSQFIGMAGALQQVATNMGQVLTVGVMPLAGALRGLATVLNENPLLTALLVGTIGTLTLGALGRGVKLLAGFGAAGLPSGIFGPISRGAVSAKQGLLGLTGADALFAGSLFAGPAGRAGKAAARSFSLAARREAGRRAALASLKAGESRAAIRGSFLSRAFLGGKATSLGARRALGAAGPIGAVVTALSLLGPVAGGVADAIQNLVGEGDGTFAALGQLLIVVLRIVELVGATINRVFDELIGLMDNPLGAALIGGALGFLVGGPMGALIGAGAGGGLALFSEDITGMLRGASGGLEGATRAVSGEGGDTINTEVTMNVGDPEVASREARSMAPTGPGSTVKVRRAT